jgi:hypothetical protein
MATVMSSHNQRHVAIAATKPRRSPCESLQPVASLALLAAVLPS